MSGVYTDMANKTTTTTTPVQKKLIALEEASKDLTQVMNLLEKVQKTLRGVAIDDLGCSSQAERLAASSFLNVQKARIGLGG